MSRRAATIVQSDIARAGRAAKQLGPEWLVEIEGGVIRLVRGEMPAMRAALSRTEGAPDGRSPSVPVAPKRDWRL
jgi:hypothetical protein